MKLYFQNKTRNHGHREVHFFNTKTLVHIYCIRIETPEMKRTLMEKDCLIRSPACFHAYLELISCDQQWTRLFSISGTKKVA